ncbi:hypothetical protein AB0D32_03350 [Micromonospora sp. NPDC048170]|uniref:hypothetical protein n=1 Tax=Micromonospora sp. NPDC048170 TaxID=3154819 RepID=UPI0033CEC817
MALAAVRDLREHRGLASAAELEAFETDVLAGFVLARASAGLADSITGGGDPLHLAEVFGISDSAAIRYADVARQLLQTTAELQPGSDHNQSSTTSDLPRVD